MTTEEIAGAPTPTDVALLVDASVTVAVAVSPGCMTKPFQTIPPPTIVAEPVETWTPVAVTPGARLTTMLCSTFKRTLACTVTVTGFVLEIVTVAAGTGPAGC